MSTGKSRLFRIIFAVALVFAAAFLLTPLPEMWRELGARIGHPGDRNALWYAGIFAACNVLLLPGGVFSFAAGALFGAWRGFLVVLLGNSIGAALAFIIGRTFGRVLITRVVSKSGNLRALRDFGARGWKMIFFSQLHPLFPTSLLVYVYSLTEISFWPCMGLIALGRAPSLLLYAFLGSLGWQGFISGTRFQMASGILAISLVLVMLRLVRPMFERSSRGRPTFFQSPDEQQLLKHADI